MTGRRELIIRLLLNNFHHGAPDLVLASLPKEQSEKILEVDVVSQDASRLLNEPKELVQQVHYSWLAPAVAKFPSGLLPFLLSALPKAKAVQVGVLLKKEELPVKPALAVRLYLLNKIVSKLKPPEVLPTPFLPPTSLMPLLAMRKAEIVQLIDFLGLYDLAEEIRHIVDKKYLKAIYSCLSIKKQHFLRICLHKKERLSVPRLGLDKWQGDCKTLEVLLHKRGLLRLGKGVSGQHPDFVWHLAHRLDVGRGEILQKYYSREEIPGVTQALVQEILSLMNFFKKSE